uniref:Uncharacterized protein n=1 Tax=Romanomermis culicivorax TaxID=13658 RepID=A0A915J235_ROMCU
RNSVELAFLREPVNVVSVANQKIVLDCTVSGNHSRVNVKWKKNDSILDVDRTRGRITISSNGSLIISSIIGSSYVQKDTESDQGVYQCVVTINNTWTFVSRKATVDVTVQSKFNEQPENKSVLEGEIVQFSCSPSTKQTVNVSWHKDNILIDSNTQKRFSVIPMSNALQIKQVQSSDQGLYQCRFGTSESPEGRLKVLKNDVALDASEPKFVVLPRGKFVGMKDLLILECAANGHPEPQISWLKDKILIETEIKIHGQGTLIISDIQQKDAGLYTCRASNSEDSVDASATIIVTTPPYFITKPQNVYAKEMQDVEFECKVGGKPTPSITWLKNGELIVSSDYFVIDQYRLKIYGLVKLDEAVYQCFAENEVGNIQTSAQLIVEAADLATLQSNLQLPSQPLNLRQLKMDGKSVTLSWDPPLNGHGSLGYVVYYKRDGSNRERFSNATLTDHKSFFVGNLTPNSQYSFRIVAFNKNGFGPSSPFLKINTADYDGLPSVVRNLQAVVVSPNSVEIRWDPPVDRNSVSFYKLFYIAVNAKQNFGDFPTNRRKNNDNDDDDYIDLDDSEETEVQNPLTFIQAVNKKGVGSTSDVVTVRTYSDVPSAAPRNVSITALTQDSVVIRWAPPTDKHRNGQIMHYKIRYRQKVRGSQVKYLNASAEESQKLIAGTLLASILGLQAGLSYNFAIAAATINGTGPYCEWATFQLKFGDKEDDVVLGPVTALKLEGHGSEIHLFWSPPTTDGNIRGYKISWGPGVPDVFHELVGPADRFHIIRNLQPNREYVVCIRAFNKADGFPVYETVRTVAVSQPQQASIAGRDLRPPIEVRAITRSASNIVLTWLDQDLMALHSSSSSKLDNRFYNVSYNSPATHGSRFRYIRAQRTSHAFEHLRPNTRYEFAVQVVLNGQRSEWSMTASNHTFSSAPTSSPMDLTVAQRPDNPNSVIINWMPPKHANGVITKYLVYYTNDAALPDSKWLIEGIRGDRMTTTIDNILPDIEYTFKIQAINDKGYSPVSSPRTFRTTSNLKNAGPFNSPYRNAVPSAPDFLGPSLTGLRGSASRINKVDGDSMNNLLPTSRHIVTTTQPPHFTLILVFVGVFGAVLACGLILAFAYVYRRRKRRLHNNARSLGLAVDGTPLAANGKDLKPPPDLWIHHDHNLELIKNGAKRNGSVLSESKNGNHVPSSGAPSLRDLEQLSSARRSPSPAPSDNQPRYHSLAMMPPPSCGTLPRNYRHNMLSTSASNNIDNVAINAPLLPQSARCYPTQQGNTPNAVYTGPKNITSNPEDDGSANVVLSNNSITPVASIAAETYPAKQQTPIHRNSNPLKSFSVLSNPPPAPPIAKIHSKASKSNFFGARRRRSFSPLISSLKLKKFSFKSLEVTRIRTVNGSSPGQAPICSDNRSPAPKLGSASVTMLKNKKQQQQEAPPHQQKQPLLSTPSSTEIYTASLTPPGQTLYGSVKDFDVDEVLNPLEALRCLRRDGRYPPVYEAPLRSALSLSLRIK